jgi:hypothetical protein
MTEQNVLAALANLTPPPAPPVVDLSDLPPHLATWVLSHPPEEQAAKAAAARATVAPGGITGAPPVETPVVPDGPKLPPKKRGRPPKKDAGSLLHACATGGLSIECAREYLAALDAL